ncbi:penicillin-binding protein [Candidatus Planktophila sulfonica]|jgi:membrane peptidoglycan carboxypeptidase|uniref:Penicillin-binding protein n=1 Tax=Candidatus Planktophila sulfonica TaxID=1884904 RepID=A0A249KIF3_9ACTN|nr:transglycosylase domain-containing protein [Candidatus Planktophila sulfonica]ASY16574.1 penicillin-binding protein [Candidatus Planktophila sulfonica]
MLKTKLIRAGVFLAGFGFVAGATLFAFAWFTVSIPDPNAYVNSQSTIIQYSNGSEIGRIGTQNRQVLPLAKIPLRLRYAVMAAEDRNFYSNRAFSATGIARALLNNLKSGSLNGEGGSTITQQYAKTAFLTPSRTVQRKIKELVISLKLENALTKDQILENYLNTIYFGRGAYGVQTAAQQYFNRNANQLTISQSAIVASILRSPGLYDPFYGDKEQKARNKARLEARFTYVINGMLDKKWITEAEAKAAKMPMIAPRTTSGQLSGPKGYIIDAVQKELSKLGFTQDQLLVGGYVIKTTLDQRAQQSAVDAVNKFTPSPAPSNLHTALVAIRPGTGEVVAMYGGKDYVVRQLNDATQSIALAGSTFKPFAIIAGLEAGIPLTSMWNGDSPQTFDDLGKPYLVSNYGDEGWGQIDLLTATQHSVNTVFVPLGIKAGMDKVVDAARRAGIPESVAMIATPSVVLGVASPHVIDVANSYATFAAQGVYSKPYMVTQVIGPNKGVLYEGKPQTQEVFSKDVMADLTHSLKSVVNGGTGGAALALGRPAAGKTGTSQSNASAWFSAYTPQLAASVALFRDSASESLNGIGGLTSVTGGTFPAKIWTAFMKGALKGEPVMSFPAPANIGGLDPVVMTSGGRQSMKKK